MKWHDNDAVDRTVYWQPGMTRLWAVPGGETMSDEMRYEAHTAGDQGVTADDMDQRDECAGGDIPKDSPDVVEWPRERLIESRAVWRNQAHYAEARIKELEQERDDSESRFMEIIRGLESQRDEYKAALADRDRRLETVIERLNRSCPCCGGKGSHSEGCMLLPDDLSGAAALDWVWRTISIARGEDE